MNARRPRRPLLGAAVFAAAGAAWGGSGGAASLGAAPVAAALALCAAACAALRFAPWRVRGARAAGRAAGVLLFSCVFLAFALGAIVRNAGRMETVELFREALDSREAAFAGRVAGAPSVVALKHGGARLSFDLEPRFIVMENDEIPVPDRGLKVRVEWYGPESMGSERPPFPVPAEGEGWLVEGRLREIPLRGPVPRVAVALRGGGGGGGGFARRAPEFDAGRAALALRDLRRAASRALGIGVDPGDTGLALVRAMVLGERADVPDSVSAAFRASGTIHVFAISGLHVGLIAVVLVGAARLFRIPRWPSFLATVAALSVYVALTGGRPSAVRALAMSVFAAAAPLAGRRPDPLLSLCGALVLLLAADPLQTGDAGFVFSFLCTAAVVALASPLDERWKGLFAAPRAAASRFAGRVAASPACRGRFGFAWRGCRRIAAWIFSIPPVSLAAWLASAPLTAALFGRVSPASVLCNVAVLPLAFAAICAALVALAEAALLPAAVVAALPAGRAAAFAASAMAKVAELAAAVPGASFETAPWPPLAVAAWYAALLALCAWLHRRR